MDTSARLTGTVTRLVRDRGFGFILADNGIEYFVHSSGCPEFHRVTEGTAVTFQIGSGVRGPRAEHVEIAQ